MIPLLGAGVLGLMSFLFNKDRETREQRYERVRYVTGVYAGFTEHFRAIHEGRFSWARDMLAFTEVSLDGALQYAPGRRMRVDAPHGISVDDEGRWVLLDVNDKQRARDRIQELLRLVDAEWSNEPGYTSRSPDERLAHELVDVLGNHVGERGHSEGAVETLKRIIRERDEAVGKAER